MPGLLGDEWGGTYTEKEICAIRGSTVKLQCSFTFPPTEDGRDIKVKETFWFTKDSKEELRLRPLYFGGVQSECHGNNCSLTIADVRWSDEYMFRFTTNHSKGEFKVTPAVKVTFTDLKVQVPESWSRNMYDLKCVSSTCSPRSPSYVWYKNGEEIPNAESQVYKVEYDSINSYSCAVRGHEQVVSPPECVYRSCNKVVYYQRRICAIQGSSVDISCEYTSYVNTQTQFWFRTDSSDPGNPSITEDPRYELPSETSGKSTLRIKDVRQSDSAEYRFKFITYYVFEWRSILPGSTLTVTAVQVQVMSVRVEDSHLVAQMLCHTSCFPEGTLSFVWYHSGGKIKKGTIIEVTLSPGDYIICAVQQVHDVTTSPVLYVLKRPSVSLSDTGDILEGGPLTLTCDIDNFDYSSATVDYCWYKKKNVSSDDEVLSNDRQLVLPSIKSSDSTEYWCTVENQLGKKTSEPVFIDVQYPPRSLSLSVSRSPVIVEGQSVNLTCSSNANPTASYTWYKDRRTLTQTLQEHYSFTSIRPEDAGTFHCMSENKHGRVTSSSVFIDVQYAPKRPYVSVVQSNKLSAGSLVNLTCSSDANPAASYTWYKENMSSPLASGQTLTIKDISPDQTLTIRNITEQGGHDYYCEANNSRGRHIIGVSVNGMSCRTINIIRLFCSAVVFVGILIILTLHFRTTSPSSTADPNELVEPAEVTCCWFWCHECSLTVIVCPLVSSWIKATMRTLMQKTRCDGHLDHEQPSCFKIFIFSLPALKCLTGRGKNRNTSLMHGQRNRERLIKRRINSNQ
ncbi:hemicentin-2-like isoform X2 [Nerophis lumbriciformis]|uniref:hemicentin-2-like isoform X2 n=1 Tax=Nerophis lumbriciformis TaxID=546530 RepID=UPI002AE065BC|nr:hemicentin-1-like isoform X2 [Nerophis lumbriciformis]